MRLKGIIGGLLLGLMFVSVGQAQRTFCIDGRCQLQRQRILQPWRTLAPQFTRPMQTHIVQPQAIIQDFTIHLEPLREEVFLLADDLEAVLKARSADRFDQIIQATVRVTIGNVCGSGTVVGRDGQGNAIVLTNAHVAGTSRGRVVNLRRWDPDGSSETGQGTIIAAGYGRGMSIDFALLRCNSGFAADVTPIPLADRYPDKNATVTTYGCPRCEWPSLQVLNLNRSEGQVLTWKPEAIGGRSGSSVIDHTTAGPRVVGLLTWGGNGEGLGQSTPFLLEAMRGRLPKTIESLPRGVREVSAQEHESVFQVPASTAGEALEIPIHPPETGFQIQDGLIDSITEPESNPNSPPPNKEPDPGNDDKAPENPSDFGRREVAELLVGGAATGAIILLLIQYGIPLVMTQVRRLRQDRGKDPLLSQEQFDELVERIQELARGIAVMEARYEHKEVSGK